MTRSTSLALALAVLAGGPAVAADCSPGTVELRGDWGQARFRVEVADSAQERSRGLMFVEEMSPSRGMLFVYPEPQPSVSFWMRNTKIPLDILFFDETGTLKTRQLDAKPMDETPLPGGSGIQYVLEINGGMAASMGIAPGTELRHPSLDKDDAAWPC